MIDLRSDTLTQPTDEMREVISQARVGDDVFDEDPTVHELQDHICQLTGKEAALFVSSGTQANQVSIKTHTQPGDELICDYRSHIFNYESASPALLSGVQLHPLHGDYGVLPIDQVREKIRPPDHHFPRTKLITVENTHNRWGGTVYPLENIREIKAIANQHQLLMHLDGARLWNASVASGISIKEYVSFFDSISMCFSKGLGAPVGSIIAGSKEFISRAHYFRKAFGGGMRQAGILAAGALYAVENNFQRLNDDHHRARILAEAVNSLPGFVVNLDTVQTNIVIIDTSLHQMQAQQIIEILKDRGLKMIAFAPTRIRAVTHLHINDNDIDQAIEIIKSVNKSG